MTACAGGEGCLLLGRTTYQTMAATWPHMPVDNPFTSQINALPKYVALDHADRTAGMERDPARGDAGPRWPRRRTSAGPALTVVASGGRPRRCAP